AGGASLLLRRRCSTSNRLPGTDSDLGPTLTQLQTAPLGVLPRPPVASILGVEYFVGGIEPATEAVIDRAFSGLGGYSCLCGVHGLVTAQHRESLMDAMRDAWMNFPDGAPVAWLLRRGGYASVRRGAGPERMARLARARAGVRG